MSIDQPTADPVTGSPVAKSAEIDSANRRRGVLRDQIVCALVTTKWTTSLTQTTATALVATANMLALTAVPFIV